MPAKKKSKKNTPDLSTVPTGEVVEMDETERLTAFNLQLKIVALNSQIEAFNQRAISLQTELEVLPKKIQEAQEQRNELAGQYQKVYAELKESYGVPEGHEINLETGLVVPNPNPQ